jgi:DNA-binding MarR family transcriptional regulator
MTETTDDTPMELPPPLADQTGYLLHRTFLYATGLASGEFPHGHGPKEVAVLGALKVAGPCSQREIADRLGVNRTMMVKLMDELERDGLVERRRNPVDRRSYALQLTREGEKTLQRLAPLMDRTDARITARLEPKEQRRLKELLRALLPQDLQIPDALADRTGFLVSKTHNMHREQGNEALAKAGIDVRDYGVMTALDDRPSSQQDIARLFGVSGTLVVQIVDGLEERGLVERGRNPDDRRSYVLHLTEAGREALARGGQELADVLPALVAPIGADGAAALRGLLRKLLGARELSEGRDRSLPEGATPRPAT